MPRYVRNVGGTLRDAKRVVRNVSGTLRDIKRIVRNVGGTLRDVYLSSQLVNPSPLPASIARNDFAFAPADSIATAYLYLERNGTFRYTAGVSEVSGDWHAEKTSTIGDQYECRFTYVSGDAFYNNSATTWTQIAGSRTLQLQAVVTTNFGTQSKDAVANVEIRKISDPSDIVSKQIAFSALAAVEP